MKLCAWECVGIVLGVNAGAAGSMTTKGMFGCQITSWFCKKTKLWKEVGDE